MTISDDASELRPYRRGTSVREVVRGALTRFLPGAVASVSGLALLFDLSTRSGGLTTVGMIAVFAGTLTLGFGIGLLALRGMLYPDARLAGRRSLLAGLFAPLALFVAVAAGVSLAAMPLLLIVVGILTALAVFFAWLTPTPPHLRDE